MFRWAKDQRYAARREPSRMNRKQRRAADAAPGLDALYARGLRHQQAGRLAEALACFRTAARQAPHAAQAPYNLGVACTQWGGPAEALAAFAPPCACNRVSGKRRRPPRRRARQAGLAAQSPRRRMVLAARPDSPWYPTMQIFTQPTPGDWASVVAEIGAQINGETMSFL